MCNFIFNTASGMAQLQPKSAALLTSAFRFQYRKRYGPVATEVTMTYRIGEPYICFNTASGMAQLQPEIFGAIMAEGGLAVSIPQAVWPSCNKEPVNMYPATLFEFQYRKRYGPVATASLESRSRTGLKWQIGKPPRFFPLLPAVSVNTSSFFTTFIRFYTSIYAGFRVHEKSGKPHFRLFFIIAGFNTNCQTAFWFSKTLDFPNSRLWIFHMLHPEKTGYF